MQKVLVTILAVAITLANALCACAAVRHMDAACTKSLTKACCQHDPVQIPTHREAPRACPHCNGTMSADAGAAKTAVDAPGVVLSPFTASIAPLLSFDSKKHPLIRQRAMPPPSSPPETLLALGCCLTL